ncbi:hypothetical protein PVBG_06217 [Plasmodium vivax Brazil I]|uniref:Uncharacterized protein n=1 Tax=Plasmodium vivax (strain Brazil I) TaxID=1033975 RepID=A0A0J9T177_PLAV1|nr:hypothetical protein PVBG_06217 [Plasmodium vivax Brazil I]
MRSYLHVLLYNHLHFSIQYKHISSLLNCQKHFDESTVLKDRELVSPCNTIASHVSGTHAFVAPCQNIIKYLNHIQYSSYDGINKIDRCRYLNFYIHKQINSNYSNPLTQNTYNTYIQAFKSRYPELNVCNDNMKYIDKEVIVNIKKILDMYIKLDKVIKASDINQDNICSSATECLGTYRSFESDCKEGSHNNELCNALENFRSYLVNSTAGMGCMESIIFPSFNVAQEKTLELEGSRTAAASLQMKDPTDEEVPDLKSSNSKTITAISTTLLLFPSLFSLYKVYKEFLSKQKSGVQIIIIYIHN